MPYKSEKQRKWMYANRPDIAKDWEEKGHNYIKGEKREKKKKSLRERMSGKK